MIELLKAPNIDFMGKRYFAFILSGILLLLGITGIIQISRGKANLGIDFAGGVAIQIGFEETFSLSEIREALHKGGLKDIELQDIPQQKKVIIKIKKKEEDISRLTESIVSSLKAGLPGRNFSIESTTEIGPKVGKRLRDDALWAIAMATLGILIYIALRFKFRFSLGATIATFHDVIAIVGIFYLLGKEFNLVVLSALLTIAGYSLTDTVVVFDRIRENMRTNIKDSIDKLINRSINEVLSRTIITSLTVLFSALALYLFGGEAIHDFSLAIILGVVIGTYSSIFVASPIVLLFGGMKTQKT
ncbi:MAG: protein translocase subunit SecF [Thermodesulfovibrionales bacterium]